MPVVRVFHPLWTIGPDQRDLDRHDAEHVAGFPNVTLLGRRYVNVGRRASTLDSIPVHSPLLGKSSLVSFPPLNYMLKFSG